MLTPVILSGGVGSRLWPLSREHYPKQLLALTGEHSLLQATAQRLRGLPDCHPPLVVCNEHHRFMVREQLHNVGIAPLATLVEPQGRNTAPAVALAALQAIKTEPEAILLVLPADHWMSRVPAFHAAIHAARQQAEAGHLVTFGITPDRPETGYGYIQAGNALDGGAYQVARFVEKPDLATAGEYLRAGDYFWNSGMFVFKARRYLEELGRFAPEMLHACEQAMQAAERDEAEGFVWPERDAFVACPADSIDYAVMENTQEAAMVPLDAGWNDIGAWSALWDMSDKDAAGNALQGDVIAVDTRNSYLRAEYRLLAAVGVDDLILVETADAVLVAHRDKAQDIKHIVSQLKQTRREEVDLHRKVQRPWGTYEVLDNEDRFKVKRIMVKPGETLSLQMHHHRAEHWVVVKGTARIERGDESFLLSENQSTYIPLGTCHRLSNPGRLPLEIIEIQSGAYLGEDDIVRLEDCYGRGK